MEFYTESRFKNWIKKIEEVENDVDILNLFDQMVEDIVIACMNIAKAVKNREIKKENAIREIEKIQRIIESDTKFNNDLKNMAYEFSIESIKAVLASFRYYLEGKTSKKDIKTLISEALKKEKKGDLNGAFDVIARIGAKILKGEKIHEFEVPDDSALLSWLDGIDAINTAIRLNEIDTGE